MAPGLPRLRDALDALDRALLGTVAARLATVRAIGEAKARLGAPVVDPRREEEKLRTVVEEAERLGLPGRLAEELFEALIRWSRCIQPYCPVRVRIAVYGPGSMGKTFASMLARAGCWVALTGRSWEKTVRAAEEVGVRAREWRDAIEWADALVYAVPSTVVPLLLEEHWSLYRESMLVSDLASVKTPVARALARLLGRRRGEAPDYASLHPLFGPLECAVGETVVVVPLRLGGEWRARLEQLLGQGLGLRLVYMDADEHDRVMAVAQVLHHAVLELLDRASRRLCERLGVDPDTAWKRASTRSLRQTLAVLDRLRQLGTVVQEIRSVNPYTAEALKALREAAEELAGGGLDAGKR